MKELNLKKLVEDLRNFKPLIRKSSISELMQIVKTDSLEDAGFIRIGRRVIVLSCDGIMEWIVKKFPRAAGYYSVLANVQDVVCKGGRPVGFLYVISSPSVEKRKKIAEGIKEGLEKFDMKFLKAHTHPDTSYHSIDGMCVGLAKKVLRSNTAEAGDHLLLAVDLKGTFTKGRILNAFESTSQRTNEEIRRQIEGMVKVAERELASAAKDVSAPGIVGTTAMLCEYSRVGALIDLKKIPIPPGMDLREWLLTYPSTCYVLSTKKPEECSRTLSKYGLHTSVIGRIIPEKKVVLKSGKRWEIFMDLNKESIFGFRK